MKYWPIVTALIAGMVITLAGALFKLMHWPWHRELLLAGVSLEGVSLLLFLYKITRKNNSDSVL